MAEIATGRVRQVPITLRAQSSQITTSLWNGSSYSPQNDDHSFANCGGFGLTLVTDSQVSSGEVFPLNTLRHSNATLSASWLNGGVAVVLLLHMHGAGQLNTSPPPDLRYTESDVEATVTGTITLTEYWDESLTRPLYERFTAYDLTFSAQASATVTGTAGGSASDSASTHLTGSGTLAILGINDYALTLSYTGCFRQKRPTASVDAGGGLKYSDDPLSFTRTGRSGIRTGTVTVGGTLKSPTLANDWDSINSSSVAVAFLSITLHPDWALQITSTHGRYKDGQGLTPKPRIYHTLYVDSSHPVLVQGNGNDGDYRLPGSNYRKVATCTVNYNAVSPTIAATIVNENNPYWSSATPSVMFQIDPTWGDNLGHTLRSNNFEGPNDFLYFPLGEPFSVAALTFAETHRYTLFESLSNWDTASGSPSLSVAGGALRFQTNGSASVWTGTASPSVYLYPLKWWAFRYHRLRVRSSAAATEFTLRLSRFTVSPVTSYQYDWHLRVEQADTWETLEVDLLWPHETVTHLGTQTGPLHAGFHAPLGLAVTIECASDVVLEFDFLEGYRKPEAGSVGDVRTPLLLCAPLSCKGSYGLTGPNGGDDCPIATKLLGAAPTFDGGYIYGRLFVNGMWGLDLYDLTYEAVETAWGRLFDSFDTAANDTGISIVPNTALPPLAAVCKNFNGYVKPNGPLWQELTPGQPFNVMCQARKTAFGYYGSGDQALGNAGYGATTLLRAEKAWDGEMIGQVYADQASLPGVTVELRDNDTDEVLATAFSDDDGLYRLFGKFGEILPVGNAITPLYSGSPPTYNATGLRFNSHWLAGERLDYSRDSTEHPIDGTGRRVDFEIYDRYPRVQDLLGIPQEPMTPWNMAGAGQYYRVWRNDTEIRSERARQVLPPFDVSAAAGTNRQPRIARDQQGRVRLFATLPSPERGIVQSISDDEGGSFGGSLEFLAGATCPTPLYDRASETVFVTSFRGGFLYGCRIRLGEAGESFPLLDAGGIPLEVEEDVAPVVVRPGDPSLWMMACRLRGEDEVSVWRSANQGASWRRYASLLASHRHPGLCVDPLGALLVAGYRDGKLRGALLFPADDAFRPEFVLQDAGGSDLSVSDSPFGLTVAREPQGRWILAVSIKGEAEPSEWTSTDFGKTWRRV